LWLEVAPVFGCSRFHKLAAPDRSYSGACSVIRPRQVPQCAKCTGRGQVTNTTVLSMEADVVAWSTLIPLLRWSYISPVDAVSHVLDARLRSRLVHSQHLKMNYKGTLLTCGEKRMNMVRKTLGRYVDRSIAGHAANQSQCDVASQCRMHKNPSSQPLDVSAS
jgi:hypothetical protein